MPRSKKAESGAGLPADETPFLPLKKFDHGPAELQELRSFFDSPLWRRVLANVRAQRPPEFPFVPPSADTEMRRQLMVEQLAQIQGWKLFEAALAKETLPKVERRAPVQDSYPDTGRIDYVKPSQNQTPKVP
jgi:hypothetical protein